MTVKDSIIKVIEKDAGLTISEIKGKVKYTGNAVSDMIYTLVHDSAVSCVNDRYYSNSSLVARKVMTGRWDGSLNLNAR